MYSNDSKIYSIALKIRERVRVRVVPAFTLTEVLLAVLIVGVIAAMVLPAVVTKYQDKTFESAFKREVHSLQDSIDSLAAVENKPSFYETSLAKTPETYMKKYLRVSKYCGTSGKDCFGKFYSEYSNHEKKTYTPSYDGNCAILKNGTSVCLNVNGGSIDMLIDVNGPKGPNVLGRDLRTYTHTVRGKDGYDMSSSGIIAINQTPIKEDGDSDPCEGKTCGCGDLPDCDPCETDNNSYACCKKRNLTGSADKCCQYEDFKDTATCHPCSVSGATYFSGIGCAYLSSPVSIDYCDPEIKRWDLGWYNSTVFHYCWGENYWAGAKRECMKLGLRLAPPSIAMKIVAKDISENGNKPLLPFMVFTDASADDPEYAYVISKGSTAVLSTDFKTIHLSGICIDK